MVFIIVFKSRIDLNARIGRNAGDLHFVSRIAIRILQSLLDHFIHKHVT